MFFPPCFLRVLWLPATVQTYASRWTGCAKFLKSFTVVAVFQFVCVLYAYTTVKQSIVCIFCKLRSCCKLCPTGRLNFISGQQIWDLCLKAFLHQHSGSPYTSWSLRIYTHTQACTVHRTSLEDSGEKKQQGNGAFFTINISLQSVLLKLIAFIGGI